MKRYAEVLSQHLHILPSASLGQGCLFGELTLCQRSPNISPGRAGYVLLWHVLDSPITQFWEYNTNFGSFDCRFSNKSLATTQLISVMQDCSLPSVLDSTTNHLAVHLRMRMGKYRRQTYTTLGLDCLFYVPTQVHKVTKWKKLVLASIGMLWKPSSMVRKETSALARNRESFKGRN